MNTQSKILGIQSVQQLNEAVDKGRAPELILVAEAIQERQLSDIVDDIVARHAKLVLLAGPSCSGKTTTSKRLSILLMAHGLHPHTLSTDDYFVNRVDTPRDASGEYDFECIEAVDTDFFQLQMGQLLAGQEVLLPRYDFPSGERVFEDNRLQLGQDDVIIIEGNHALNPLFSTQIEERDKYRIYISASTDLLIDGEHAISDTDIRLLRRISRDYKYRGYSAQQTIKRCPSVSVGEEKWITPYRSLADADFNSALLFEQAVITDFIIPLLEQVTPQELEYAQATRLCAILRHFKSIPANEVPRTSLLREFVGDSLFHY